MKPPKLHTREDLLPRFNELRETHLALCSVVSSLLQRILPSRIVVASSHRIKDFESFFAKANKIEDGQLKYKDPFSQIVDLVGFRIIVVARINVDIICEALRKALTVIEEKNKAEELLKKGVLGYESHHIIARLGDDRKDLMEYASLCEIAFEIQVRTALQHAWAENEHRVQYKTKKNPELNKRFLRLAGIISSADEEFDRIYEINERLRRDVEEAVSKLQPEKASEAEHDKELRGIALMFGMPAIELVRRHRFTEAIQVYDRFVDIQPKQPTHYAGRARAKALAGDLDGALDDLEQAEKLAPDHPAVKNVLRLLNELIPDLDDDEEDQPLND